MAIFSGNQSAQIVTSYFDICSVLSYDISNICFVHVPLLLQLRRKIRPHFQRTSQLKLSYDIFTWTVTQILLSYTVVPFTLLHIQPSITFYK